MNKNPCAHSLWFSKYQGLGNDFILIDCKNSSDHSTPPLWLTAEECIAICDRHFGVGADGVIMYSSIDTMVLMLITFVFSNCEQLVVGILGMQL